MINSRNSKAVFTSEVAGTRYTIASWWQVDKEGYALAGPNSSKKGLAREVAILNRLMKSGQYTDRP